MGIKKLKKTVKKAKKEVEVLLKEVQGRNPDKIKLENGLEEVQGNLRTLSIHIGRIDDDDDEDDSK